MAATKIVLEFDGSDARAAAQEWVDFLAQQPADWSSEIAERTAPARGEVLMRGVDPITWITLTVSLLTVADKALSLAERIKLKEKISRLVAWARQRRRRGQAVPRLVLPRAGRSVPLDEARLEETLDEIAPDVAGQRADPA